VPLPADYRYWGLQSRANNVNEDALTERFRLGIAATAAMLGGGGGSGGGGDSRAKPVDVLLGFQLLLPAQLLRPRSAAGVQRMPWPRAVVRRH
jgi:hypothetical protein